MPKYRVTATSFIGDQLVQEGELVDYEGLPGFNLVPADAAAQAVVDSLTLQQRREGMRYVDPHQHQGA
jgi:hypothetical protein